MSTRPQDDAPFWRRLLRCPAPTRKAPTMTTQPDTPDAPDATAAERIHDLRAERARIDAHEAADPLDTAQDLDAWHLRNQQRSRRRAEIERQVRDLTDYGLLVDTHLPAIRAYLTDAAAVRAYLAPLANQRQGNPKGDSVTNAGRVDIFGWYHALLGLARALPFEHPDAQRVLDREYQAWLTARNGWAIMQSLRYNQGQGGWLPSPECGIDAGLPPGMRYGIYRIADDGTITIPATP